MAASDSNIEGQGGSSLDFEAVVQAQYAGLYRFAMSLTRSETDAADLVQETFLTWAEKGGQLLDATKARSWLFTTLHRAFLGTQRKIVRFPQVDIAEAPEDLLTIEPDLVSRLDGARLLELLAEVDEQYRTAVALFYLEDCSYEEIAEIAEVPLGTVKSRIARGIKQLKSLVAREEKAALKQQEKSA